MASAFARYRGTSRQIEHNARHLSRPLDLPIMGVGGERVFGGCLWPGVRARAWRLLAAQQ